MQLADTLIATLGDLIASSENEPFNRVSRKHLDFSSTVHMWYSTARAQTLGQSSIMRTSSILFKSGFFAF